MWWQLKKGLGFNSFPFYCVLKINSLEINQRGNYTNCQLYE
jgi:hypothetical protein